MHIHGTEKEVNPTLVLKKAEKKRYLAAVFIQPDCTYFATVDLNNVVQIFSVKTKDEVRTIVGIR